MAFALSNRNLRQVYEEGSICWAEFLALPYLDPTHYAVDTMSNLSLGLLHYCLPLGMNNDSDRDPDGLSKVSLVDAIVKQVHLPYTSIHGKR